jgi:hypothetical protein
MLDFRLYCPVRAARYLRACIRHYKELKAVHEAQNPSQPFTHREYPTGDPSNDAWSLGINLGLHPEPRWDDNGNRVDEDARYHTPCVAFFFCIMRH